MIRCTLTPIAVPEHLNPVAPLGDCWPVTAHVLTVIGTRPEAIKMLPVVTALRRSEFMDPVVVSTGQHSEMVREILAIADVTPGVDLGSATDGSLNDLSTAVMGNLQEFCERRYDHDGSHRVRAMDLEDVFERGYPAGALVREPIGEPAAVDSRAA